MAHVGHASFVILMLLASTVTAEKLPKVASSPIVATHEANKAVAESIVNTSDAVNSGKIDVSGAPLPDVSSVTQDRVKQLANDDPQLQPLTLKVGSSPAEEPSPSGSLDEISDDASKAQSWKTQCLKSCHGKCEPERPKGSQALYGCVNYCLKLQAAAVNLDYQNAFRPELDQMLLKDELPMTELESLDFETSFLTVMAVQTTDMAPALTEKDTVPVQNQCDSSMCLMTSDLQYVGMSLFGLVIALALTMFVAKRRRSKLFYMEHHYQPLV